MTDIVLSPLAHTWLIDVDGTIFAHNAHLAGEDAPLPGVRAFWDTIPAADRIILLTARAEGLRAATVAALEAAGLRFDDILFALPTGERILINDRKPSGLRTALAVDVQRDGGLESVAIRLDPFR